MAMQYPEQPTEQAASQASPQLVKQLKIQASEQSSAHAITQLPPQSRYSDPGLMIGS
jgi:hypothetical protein